MSVEKACIKVLEACSAGGVDFNKDEKIFAQFNPEKYSINANVRFSFSEKEGKIYGQYSGQDSRTLSVELFFDMLSTPSVYKRSSFGLSADPASMMDEVGAVSAAYINRIMALTKPGKDKGAPPMVEFLWGGEVFRGVISSATLNYVLFNKKGEPTRATIAITFKSCDDVIKANKNEKAKLSGTGAPGTMDIPTDDAEIKEALIKALKLL